MNNESSNIIEPFIKDIDFNDPGHLQPQTGKIVFPYAPKSGNIHTASLNLPKLKKSQEVLDDFVLFFYSRDFTKLTPGAKSPWRTYIKRFSDFLASLSDELPINLGHIFLNYLKRSQIKEHGIYDTMRCTRWVFIKIKERLEQKQEIKLETLTSKKYRLTISILNSWPTISVPNKNPRKSMRESLLPENSEYLSTDGELIHSLRFVLLAYLETMQKLREKLENNSPDLLQEITEYLREHYEREGTDTELSEKLLNKNKKISVIYRKMIDVIIKMDNELLIELLFIDQIVQRTYKTLSPFNRETIAIAENLNKADKILILQSLFNGNQLRHHLSSSKIIGNKGQVPVVKFNFSLCDALAPSLTERIALSMLLASDRIQASNQKRMSSSNFIFGSNRLEITSYKKRSKKSDKIFYLKSKPQYKIYKKFIDGTVNYNKSVKGLTDHEISKLPILNLKATYAPIATSKPVRGINLICFENSAWRKHIESLALSKPDLVSTFVFYWRSILKKNDIKFGSRNISLDEIGRSRINIHDEDESYVATSDNMSTLNESSSLEHKSREITGLHHDVFTHYDVYRRRSQISIENQDRFAALVGDEMEKSANILKKIIDKKKKESIALTPSDARHVLGLNKHLYQIEEDYQLSELIANTQVKEYVSGVFNQISNDGITIILITPLNAELIKQYINHIDCQIDNVAANNIERADMCAIRALVLGEVLNRFPKKVVFEGKNRYGHFKFPFPDLMVTIQ